MADKPWGLPVFSPIAGLRLHGKGANKTAPFARFAFSGRRTGLFACCKIKVLPVSNVRTVL